jgi:hypothetical protein
LLRDRDRIYGEPFPATVHSMGIHEVLTARHSPWAKSLLRAPHWLDPKGMSGPFHRLQRAWPAPHFKVLFRILRTIANSFVAGQGCSPNPCHPSSRNGPSH